MNGSCVLCSCDVLCFSFYSFTVFLCSRQLLGMPSVLSDVTWMKEVVDQTTLQSGFNPTCTMGSKNGDIVIVVNAHIQDTVLILVPV